MDTLSFLANLLLSVTVGTLTVALVAYLAYGVREKRKPSGKGTVESGKGTRPVFLRRYVPDRDGPPPRFADKESNSSEID
jgi:hypothetical protein